MIKACIFDLDGTAIYTLESIALAGNRMLRELGLPEQPVDDYRYYCGDGSENLVKRCLKKVGACTDENVRAGNILNRKFLAEQPLYHARAYEGLPEVLEDLKEKGIALAVFSNKPDDAAKSAVSGIYGDLFDAVQGQTAEIPIKPDPTGALSIAAQLKVRPEECLYLGDTWTDMRTGKAAGMLTAGVLWGYRDEKELLENGADLILTKPEEIPEVVFGTRCAADHV